MAEVGKITVLKKKKRTKRKNETRLKKEFCTRAEVDYKRQRTKLKKLAKQIQRQIAVEPTEKEQERGSSKRSCRKELTAKKK